MSRSEHGPDSTDGPVLITEAAVSYEEEFAARKRKYMLMMALRLPCLVLAGLFYQTPWLAFALMAISVPLPWIAVLLANDGPARKAEDPHKFQRETPAIEDGKRRAIAD